MATASAAVGSKSVRSALRSVSRSDVLAPLVTNFSTARSEADTETQRKRDYLRTMLGKDMAGERYLTQLVTAATAQQQQLMQHAKLPTTTQHLTSYAAITPQFYNIPVVSIKWNCSIDSIKTDLNTSLASLAENDSVFLDFAGTSADNHNTVASVVHHLTKGTKLIHIIGAVNCLDSAAVCLAKTAGLVQVNHRSRGGNAPSVAPSSPAIKQTATMKSTAVKEPTASTSVAPASSAAMVHYGAVRSGQQIYAEGSSLIIIGSVNDGAEVLADGDIHVYGSLKGRAMAGLGGSVNARVFAHIFDASLVGISDAFTMPDDCPSLHDVIGKPVSVRLLKKSDSSEDVDGKVVDCGNGNRLVVSVLPLKET